MEQTKRALVVVDLQKEFEDTDGMYERILHYVKMQIDLKLYDKVIATVCGNNEYSPFYIYTGWSKMLTEEPQDLEFKPDEVIYKTTYGLHHSDIDKFYTNYVYDIVGFNTDACVLKVALDLADAGREIRILSDYCYSSSGREAHERGVAVLKSLLGRAVF